MPVALAAPDPEAVGAFCPPTTARLVAAPATLVAALLAPAAAALVAGAVEDGPAAAGALVGATALLAGAELAGAELTQVQTAWAALATCRACGPHESMTQDWAADWILAAASGLHWQAKSVAPQPAEPAAVARHLVCWGMGQSRGLAGVDESGREGQRAVERGRTAQEGTLAAAALQSCAAAVAARMARRVVVVSFMLASKVVVVCTEEGWVLKTW